jgi:hypothetical protein
VKGGKKDLMSTEEAGKKGNTDWPFLDRGSQSACRRSRERSSSSSSSSSSGSSSSDSSSSSRSSASSRSSSPASASPKSSTVPRNNTSPHPPYAAPSAASKTISSAQRGPSRKLKTSDRSPVSGTEYETPKGKKPAPKSRGPNKLRSGRTSASSSHAPTEPHPKQQQPSSIKHSGEAGRNRKSSRSSSSSSSSSRCSQSPSSNRKRDKSSEEESKRRARESSEVRETSKKDLPNSAAGGSKFNLKPSSSRTAKAKALVKSCVKTQNSSGILDLSSDSEVESATPQKPSAKSPKHISSQEKESKESANSNNDSKGSKTPSKAKKKGSVSALSESEKEGAENEKENSCLTPEVSALDAASSNSKTKPQSKTTAPPCPASILSPLTPSSDNKEKEQSSISKSSDTEPELKRPRLDSGTGASSHAPVSHMSPPSGTETSSGASLQPSTSLTGNAQHPSKSSLFSPTRLGNENELIDFDTELYDLARSVSADYAHCDEDGGMAGGSGSLPFSFTQNLLFREDNGEDSGRATLNLVEKLRLQQHARMQSVCPRSSIDGSDLSVLEDASKSPCSLRQTSESNVKDGSTLSCSSGAEVPSILREDVVFEEGSKSDATVSKMSPGKDRIAQGDERWVPPSEISPEISKPLSPLVVKDFDMSHKPLSNVSTAGSMISPMMTKDVLIGYDKDKDRHKLSDEGMSSTLSLSRTPQPHRTGDELLESENTQHTGRSSKLEEISITENQGHGRDGLFGPPISIEASSLDSSGPIMTSPGVKLPHGLQFSGVGAAGSASSYPTSTSHSGFMYPLAGAPSINSVVNSLAAAVGPNSTFFRPHSQQSHTNPNACLPLIQQDSQSSPSQGFTRQGFTPASSFLHAQQHQQSQSQTQKGKDSVSTVSTPTVSPSIGGSQCSASEFGSDKSMSESMVSSVTAGMPPLAKPSIASPSMIIAANNVKNIVPAPPPQSTVAQIIENVVNNHTNNTNYPINAQDLLSAMLNMNSSGGIGSLGANSGFTVQQGQRNSKKSPVKSPYPSCVLPSSVDAEMLENVSNGGGRVKEGAGVLRENFDAKSKDILTEGTGFSQTNAVSPRGRGRRSTTPRATKTEKALTNGVKGKGRGERKSASSASPARAKPAPSRRGGGRGKGKGKVVVTRKDLAGTVYDIDFDEFEENVDEKLDLRMLRERRKSSDIHADVKLGKSEALLSPVDIKSPKVEISPKTRDIDLPRAFTASQKGHNQLQQSNSISNNDISIAPMLQPPLPGPVDMRTYSLSSGSQEDTALVANKPSKTEISRKQPKTLDISAAFSSGSAKQTIVNEFEELDQTLEALTSAPKSVQTPNISKPPSDVQLPSLLLNEMSAGMSGSHISKSFAEIAFPGIETTVENLVEPELKSSMDFSRNQLKVKIKGPFLDANYGSHSITGDVTPGPQHFQNSFHHSSNPSQMMMNTPTSNTSNLRRMRKKELLRQYWTQDMNMDGSACGPMQEGDMSGIAGNSLPHPINRSIITIPKAVASMAIIPTKDDYRESLPSDNLLGNNLSGMSKDAVCSGQSTEKKKRSRGMREMVALGIISCDSPRERRRDRMEGGSLSGSSFSTEMMGKKRGKGNKRPIRSTFIPPTLVESDTSTGERKSSISIKGNILQQSTGPKAMSTVVTAVNHPTPKLKIKFGDMSKGMGGASVSNPSIQNHVLSDSSDKETPNKKAKGRPPKKRGISEIAAAAPPTMEELKRQNMKYREMVMQDFDLEERKEILELRGTRKHKKHKRKGASSETDEGGRPKSPNVKVISDGSKLILRFNKPRTAAAGGNGSENSSNPGETKGKINSTGNGVAGTEVKSEDLLSLGGENDSGFTGGSEGSSGSVSELTGASKDRPISSSSSAPPIKTEVDDSGGGCPSAALSSDGRRFDPTNRETLVIPPSAADSNPETRPPPPPDPGSDFYSQPSFASESTMKSSPLGGTPNESEDFGKSNSKDKKIMPIRLKLSRCFEGYALKNKKQEGCAGDGGPPGSTPTKQSDSCEVR